MSYLEEKLSLAPSGKKWMHIRIQEIKTAPDGARKWLRDLGKNDFDHAQAVEEYVGKILSEANVDLSLEEIYLLLHSIYTHDVGYRESQQNHSQQSYEMLTRTPESFHIHDRNLAMAIALVCLAHGIDDLSRIPTDFPIDFLTKTVEFDLRFLGALLLIADELDQGYLRVLNRADQYTSPRQNVYHVDERGHILNIKYYSILKRNRQASINSRSNRPFCHYYKTIQLHLTMPLLSKVKSPKPKTID